MASLHVACVATQSEGYFETYMRSLQHYGYESSACHVLGWQTPWSGFGYKLTLFQQLLDRLCEDDIVVLTDAYDVLCTAPKNVCLERYYAMGAPVIVSVNATPTSPLTRHLYHMIFPVYQGHNLNTGLWMGRVDRLRPILSAATAFVERYNDDQLAIIKCLAATASEDIITDDTSHVFLNVGSFEALTDETLSSSCFVHGWYNTNLTRVIELTVGKENDEHCLPTQHYMSVHRVAHYAKLLGRLQRERLLEFLGSAGRGRSA